MDSPDELKNRYKTLIENIADLKRQPGVTLARAMRTYIDEWDELVGARGVYSLSKAASDIGVSRQNLATIASRARAAARKGAKPSDRDPRTTRPTRNTAAPDRHSQPAQNSTKPTSKSGSKPASKNRPQDETPSEDDDRYFVSDDGIYICRYGETGDDYPNATYRWYRESKKFSDFSFS